MKLITLSRKASGRLYNAIKKEDGGFVNPLVEFQGIDVDHLPSIDELLKFVGDKAARYIADGYNSEAFELAKDPFDSLIPEGLDEEKYKQARTAMINMVKFMDKSPEEVAKLLGWR